MATLDDINWNELPIIARENGELSVWRAWKRSIAAFSDPQMWKDTSKFSEYFERLEDNRWGMAGYGMIVVDFDTKQMVSINDYSNPSSLFLPGALTRAGGDPSGKALLALLSDPSQWPNVAIRVGPEKSLLDTVVQAVGLGDKEAPLQTEVIYLDKIIPEGATIEQALERITLDRGNTLLIKGASRMVLEGAYLPQGWSETTDMGQAMPRGLLNVLRQFKDAGFPPPVWEDVEEKLTSSYELPITEEDIQGYIDNYCDDHAELEPGEIEEFQSMQQMGREFLELKAQWSSAPLASKPNSPRP